MVVKTIQIARWIELVGYIVCLLCLFWPWGKISYLVPSQIDIVSRMQLLLLVQLIIIVIVRFLEKRLFINFAWGDLMLAIYCFYFLCRGGLYTVNYIELSTGILFYWVFRAIRSDQIVPCLVTVWLSGCFQVGYGFYKQSGFGYTPDFYMERITGTFFNTGIFGGYILILFSIGICCWWLFPVMNKWRWVYMAFSIFYLLVLYNASSRSAWLACLFLMIYIFSYRYRLFKSGIVYKLCLFVGLLTLLVIVCIWTDYKMDSIVGRVIIWIIALYMVCLHPIFGLGVNGLQSTYMEYQSSCTAFPAFKNWVYLLDDNFFAFNEVLRITVEQGLVGLILVMGILYVLVAKEKPVKEEKRDENLCRTMKILIIVWLLFSLFSYPFFIFQMFLLLILFVAMRVSLESTVVTVKYTSMRWAIQSVLLICIFVGLRYYWVKPYADSLREWSDVLRTSQFETSKSMIGKLKKVERYLKEESSFSLSLARLYQTDKQYKEALNYYEESNRLRASFTTVVEYAEVCMQTDRYAQADSLLYLAMNMVPSRIKPYYCLALSLYRQGKLEDACKVLQEGLAKPVKVNTMYVDDLLLRMRDLKGKICSNKL